VHACVLLLLKQFELIEYYLLVLDLAPPRVIPLDFLLMLELINKLVLVLFIRITSTDLLDLSLLLRDQFWLYNLE